MHSVLHSNEFKYITQLIVLGNQQLNENILKIDEDKLSALMERHRIGPLVYSKLSDPHFRSQEFHAYWKRKTLENQKTALQVKGFQGLLSSLLNEKGVDHVYLKGIDLSGKYYGDLGLRHVLDVDLLISEQDLDLVSEMLIQLGYNQGNLYSHLSKRQKKFLRYVDHDMQFIAAREGLPALIELHWKWRGSLGGFSFNEIRALDEEELFLYLVVHGTEHAWFRLKWLVDIYKMLDLLKFNWKYLKQRAEQLDSLIHLEISFLVLKKIFGVSIPEEFSYVETEHLHQRKLKYIFNLISSEVGFNENDSNRIQHLFYLQSLSKSRINLPLILKYLISPKDWGQIKLPDRLFFLYVPLRPFMWLLRKLKN